MSRILCIFSRNQALSQNVFFEYEYDYYSFLYTHRNEIEWSKLIDIKTGETIDEYHNFKTINPNFFNLEITKEQFPNVETLLLLNQQKLMWFIEVINKYSETVKEKIKNGLKMRFHPLRQSKTNEKGYFIPPNLVLVDKKQLLSLYEEVHEELKDSPYKLRVLKSFVDLDGFEIHLNNYLLK